MHLVLIFSLVVALVPLLLFNIGSRVTIHVVIACAFAALVVVHLGQRRRTLRRLAAGLARVGSWLKPSGRLAFSDGILIFLLLNVIVSGSLDLATGGTPAFRISCPGTRSRACFCSATWWCTSSGAGSGCAGQ